LVRQPVFIQQGSAMFNFLPKDDKFFNQLDNLARMLDWNWPEAEAQFKQAIDLDHSDAGARSDYSIAAYVKEFDGAPSEELRLHRKSFEDGGLRGSWLHDIEKRADKGLLDPCWETFPGAHLGQTQRTLQLLDYGFKHHCHGLQFIGTEPIYDKFRSEPWFQELLARMKLPVNQFTN
jgi:hypothetical protein